MLRWQQTGILLTGPAGIGKSTLGLELLEQGAVLIADDVVEISQRNQQLIASCPENIQGLLHSRELGFLDIRQLFGAQAWQAETPLDAIVNLQPTHPDKVQPDGQQSRLKLLDLTVPKLDLCIFCPVSPATRIKIWLKLLSSFRSEPG